jgi:uncharacterized OsmC-like protein
MTLTEDRIVNTVHSTTTHVFGRTVNSARDHHFVIDGTHGPAEELTPVEIFLSSISACGLHLIERFADEAKVSLERAEAEITGSRPKSAPQSFDHVDLRFTLVGPTQKEAEKLVERFKGR